MKFKGFILGLLLCCFTCVAFANVPLMPIKDLKPGMQGIGKTVIKGDTIEEFNVEVLGVTGSEAAGHSILVRLYGDLIEKTGGVAQGMSGSPVYVDGRLVGAVAFGKTFNDPHYCFLTPTILLNPSEHISKILSFFSLNSKKSALMSFPAPTALVMIFLSG